MHALVRLNRPTFRVFFALATAAPLGVGAADALKAPVAPITAKASSPYTTGRKTRDGLGVYYFGREIAHYMTHHGAPWLERGEREIEERPDLVMKALALKPGEIVADLGCGTGYFSWRMAQAVAPGGIVYGVEIQPQE